VRTGNAELLKGLEQLRLVRRGYARAGVDYAEPGLQQAFIALLRQLDADRAAVGKFDRVAGEVEQDLRQRAAIGADHRLANRHTRLELEPLRFAQGLQRRAHVVEHGLARHGSGFQHDLAGLDLGEVEQIVDQRQQVLELDWIVVSCFACSGLSGPGSFISIVPVKPMIAFSGVRSSCDMLARKRSFAGWRLPARRSFSCSVRSKRLRFGHVARRREHALQLAVAVVKGRGVVRHHGFLAVLGARRSARSC
jgi:hypothetical protein